MRNKFILGLAKRLIKNTEFQIIRVPKVSLDTTWMNRLLYFNRMFDLISSVDGDIVECGVGKGRTFLLLAFLATKEGKGRKLWGFDSFEGFPQPSAQDASSRHPRKGEWAGERPEDVFTLLKRGKIDKHFLENNIEIVRGFFNRTLNSYQGRSIALLHIDADLYNSYRLVLEELFPKVTARGVVLFDEYKEAKWPGATKAIDEYFQGSPWTILQDGPSKKYYLIKK